MATSTKKKAAKASGGDKTLRARVEAGKFSYAPPKMAEDGETRKKAPTLTLELEYDGDKLTEVGGWLVTAGSSLLKVALKGTKADDLGTWKGYGYFGGMSQGSAVRDRAAEDGHTEGAPLRFKLLVPDLTENDLIALATWRLKMGELDEFGTAMSLARHQENLPGTE